ncbi:MAG: L-lactate dehydrogenase [Caulobacteraceae bacterium]|nr:L-lactate dehydrogenase [Caulobacteraceae bacterium]
MKVGIVGAGAVGATAAYSVIMTGAASDIVLVDVNEKLARAQAEDLSHATPYTAQARVSAGPLERLDGAGLVLFCCGAAQTGPNETRLQLLQRNAEILREVVPRVVAAAPDAILVLATNPVDVMTDLTAKLVKRPQGRVFGSGTILDSARMRAFIAEELGIAASSVHANVLGEHGDSEVLAWSSVQVGVFPLASFADEVGRPITAEVKADIDTKVRKAAYHIIEGKGSTSYGVGMSLARIVRAIRDDEKAILTVSSPGNGKGPTRAVSLSLPSVLGAGGVEAVLHPRLSSEEDAALERSADLLEQAGQALWR